MIGIIFSILFFITAMGTFSMTIVAFKMRIFQLGLAYLGFTIVFAGAGIFLLV